MNAKLEKSFIVVVFTLITYLTIFCGSLSFAECPSGYPYDCGDGWCCGNKLFCLLPSEVKEVLCREESEPDCSSIVLYGECSEETELLRYFRDNVLIKTPEGRELIKLYYLWSPIIVEVMEKDEGFKEEVKEMIDGILLLIGGI